MTVRLLRVNHKKHYNLLQAQITDIGILLAYKPDDVTPLQNAKVPHYSKLLDSPQSSV